AILAEDQELGTRTVPVFRAAGVAAAVGLSYLVSFAGPSHIVLCAPAVLLQRGRAAADEFLDQIEKETDKSGFRDFVAHTRFRDCKLVRRPLGAYDGALAAALVALQRGFALRPRVNLIERGPTK
ncbi:MAG: hypothetical protein LC808_09945, partial [Actinobacteria bacterium]|nr:hypothetical protein [Actinomycetota bacterium]